MTQRSLAVLFSVVALIACGPISPPATMDSTDPNGQTIILWHSADGGVRRALLTQIDEFNATNPWHILVVPEYRGGPADLTGALNAAVDAARTPDLVLGRPLDVTWLGDSVVPVEPYTRDARYGLSDADRSDLYPAMLDANRDPQRDNALVSFPIGSEGTVLLYNADRLAAAGYLTPPDSWPLFREVCLVTTVDRTGDRQPDVYGFGFAPRASFVAAWFVSRDAPLLLPDGRTLGFDNASGVNVLETLSESAQGGCFLPTPGPAADLEAFSSGRVAMIFASTADLRDVDQIVRSRGGFRWGVAPVPYGRHVITLDVSGQSWIVLNSTPEKQLAAWLFARWFATTEQTLAWALNTGQLPLRVSAVRQLKNLYSEAPNEIAALDLLRFGQADPLVSYWPEVAEVATRAVLAVVAGDAPGAAHAQAVGAVSQLVAP
jgi:ABC-type glycerol-3-phosphate transport system substrate-binding protein